MKRTSQENWAIELKSPREITALRDAGRIVAQVFARLAEAVRPGITLRELDRLATDYLKSQGAQPLYKGYRGNPSTHPPFPGVICTSVNHEICHGLPDKRVLRQGDIVAVDIGLKYKGYCGDACVTYAIGQVAPEAQQLMKVTQECLYLGIDAAQAGRRLSDIGAAEGYQPWAGDDVWPGRDGDRNRRVQRRCPHRHAADFTACDECGQRPGHVHAGCRVGRKHRV